MDRLVYLRDVVTLRLEREKCIGCGMCLQVCPHAVFISGNGTVDPFDGAQPRGSAPLRVYPEQVSALTPGSRRVETSGD